MSQNQSAMGCVCRDLAPSRTREASILSRISWETFRREIESPVMRGCLNPRAQPSIAIERIMYHKHANILFLHQLQRQTKALAQDPSRHMIHSHSPSNRAIPLIRPSSIPRPNTSPSLNDRYLTTTTYARLLGLWRGEESFEGMLEGTEWREWMMLI